MNRRYAQIDFNLIKPESKKVVKKAVHVTGIVTSKLKPTKISPMVKTGKFKGHNECELTETELRVLRSLHLRGCTGKMGSLNRKERLAILTGLIDRGYLTGGMNLTEKGIQISAPKY